MELKAEFALSSVQMRRQLWRCMGGGIITRRAGCAAAPDSLSKNASKLEGPGSDARGSKLVQAFNVHCQASIQVSCQSVVAG